MATSIVVSGRRTSKPGTYMTIDANGLAQLGPGAVGVVALVGEAEGGKPLDVTPSEADSATPERANARYRSGPMRTAAAFAFQPANDDLVTGGASLVVGVKVNPATQSSGVLYDEEGAPVAQVLSADYGAFTERVSMDVENGTAQGKRLVYTLDDDQEQFDNVGGDGILRALITTLPNWGRTALWARRFLYDVRGRGTRDSTRYAAAGSGDHTVTLVSTNTLDVMNAVVTGINLLGAVVTETIALSGTTPVVTAAIFNTVTGVVLATPCIGIVTAMHNQTTDVPVGGIAGGGRTIGVVTGPSGTITGRQVRVFSTHDTQVGDKGRVIVRGLNAALAAATEIVTLGTTPTLLSTNFSKITQIEFANASLGTVFVRALSSSADLVAGDMKMTDTVDLDVAMNLGAARVLTFTPASATTVNIVVSGINAAGAFVSETVALSGAGAVSTVATWRSVLGILPATTTLVDIQLSVYAEALIPAGTEAVGWGGITSGTLTNFAVGTDLFCLIRGGDVASTCPVAISGENAAGTVETVIVDVTANSLVWVSNTWRALRNVNAAQLPSGATVELFAGFYTVSGATYDTVAKAVDRLNTDPDTRIAASVLSQRSRNETLANLDHGPWVVDAHTSPGASLTADLTAQINRTNTSSRHVRLTRDTFAQTSLGNIATPRFLSGGVEGTTTITEWQEAFRLLKKRDVNIIVVLTHDSAVHALLLAHLRERASTLALEANGYVGHGTADDLGETRENIKTRIVALQSRHLSHVAQEFQRAHPDTAVSTWWPPYMLAAASAGIQAATAIGEPSTRKRLLADDIRNDSSWQVEEDIEAMIDMGLMAFEKKDGKGVLCVRSITGHLVDDNPVFCEMSANESLITSVRRLREELDLKVGRRGLANTEASLKSIATAELDGQTEEPIILGWNPRTLTIERQADSFPVSVEILPMLGINFIPVTVHVAVIQ